MYSVGCHDSDGISVYANGIHNSFIVVTVSNCCDVIFSVILFNFRIHDIPHDQWMHIHNNIISRVDENNDDMTQIGKASEHSSRRIF